MLTPLLALALAASPAPPPLDSAADRQQVAAIVDSALAALSRGDLTAFTDFMIDEAIMIPVGPRDGQFRHAVRTRAAQRAATLPGKITERPFRVEVHVSGPVAQAWAPYDLYIDGKWSHCGADAFTLVKTSGVWKIATLAWSVEQPPACAKHPAGPPAP